MSELKPCPFCKSHEVGYEEDVVNGYACFFIECFSCGARGSSCNNWTWRDVAKEAWNTRPIEDALRTENEAQAKEIDGLKAKLEKTHNDACAMYKALEVEVEGTKKAYTILELPEDAPIETALDTIKELKAKVAELEDGNLEYLQAYFFDENERNLCGFDPKKATSTEELMQLLFLHISKIEADNQRMRATITKCASVFEQYAKIHDTKTPTPQNTEKAQRNRDLFCMCNNALQGGES